MTTALEATKIALDASGAKKVLVAVSGGKDSLCVLDTCVRELGAANVVGFCMVLVPDLDVEWRPIRALERRYGIQVLSVPHYELSRIRKNCILAPYVPGSESLRVLKQVDTENHLRRQTGIEWCAWGMKAADSLERNAYLKRIQGVDPKSRRVYPIWTWKKRDVYGYLHARKIPAPKIIGGGKVNGGVTLDAGCLRWLREHHPKDFAKVLQAFPYAGALVFRLEHEEATAQAAAGRSEAVRREGPEGDRVDALRHAVKGLRVARKAG